MSARIASRIFAPRVTIARTAVPPARRFIASTSPSLLRPVFASARCTVLSPSRIQKWRGIATGGEDGGSKLYSFEDVLSHIQDPSSSRLLIDVREPHEYNTNSIPTAINIPVTSSPDALLMDPEDFEDRFGFEKPPLEKEIVLFCKAGVRSSAAAGIARQAGYKNVGEYKGSWREWLERGGPGMKG